MVGQTLLVGGFDEGKDDLFVFFKIVSPAMQRCIFLVDGKDGIRTFC